MTQGHLLPSVAISLLLVAGPPGAEALSDLRIAAAQPTASPGGATARTGALQQADAGEIIARSRAAFYEAGTDMRARITMSLIAEDGRTRERELTMLRKNTAEDEQRYYIFFHRPPDVRATAFLIRAYPERDDDRWIYVPAIDLVRRIAAEDAGSSFVGSDFSYEDVSGRDVHADRHRLLREDTVESRPVYVLESVPERPADYQRKVSWIDQTTYLPLREEHYNVQGNLQRVYTSDEIQDIDSPAGAVPTVTKRTMQDVTSGHRTEVVFVEVSYNVGLEEDVFTEASLRRPPRRWIR